MFTVIAFGDKLQVWSRGSGSRAGDALVGPDRGPLL
jgi:hypothetical protein